jgi:hypothetical protein
MQENLMRQDTLLSQTSWSKGMASGLYNTHITIIDDDSSRGAQYLMGENLEVVWAEFLTVS